MVTEKPRQSHFVSDQDNIVKTDASRTGLGITLRQKQSDNTIRRIAFASIYLNDTEKSYLVGELDLLGNVRGTDKYGSVEGRTREGEEKWHQLIWN